MKLRLLTWNINGLDEKRIGPRMEKLCLEVLVGGDLHAALEGRPTPPVPDVIVFQEMTRRAQMGQIRPHLSAAGFALFPEKPPEGRDSQEDYSLIAVRRPWKMVDCARHEFEESPLGRSYLKAALQGPGGSVSILSGHMESLRSGRDARMEQARELNALLQGSDVPALFAGDTNLRADEWRELKRGFARDAFEVAGSPADAKDTWWPEESPRGFRFDRVWLSAGWSVESMRTRRLEGVSDHAGLEVRLAYTSATL